MERTNLSKEQVRIIEDNFLKLVAKKLNSIDAKPTKNDFDPMVV